MGIDKQVQEIMDADFDASDSLLRQGDIVKLEEALSVLEPQKKRGYTLPLIDTIGITLKNKIGYKIED